MRDNVLLWILPLAVALLATDAGASNVETFRAEALEHLKRPSMFPVPDGHSPGFTLSDNYPRSPPVPEEYPWASTNLLDNPEQYLHHVLQYVVAGNIDVDWRLQDYTTRKWHHAPWMHYGRRGREPIHGLTWERDSRPYELHANQSERASNWAIGFYNPPGGYALGQVWADPSRPNTSSVLFPNGTVSAKLLFTTATSKQVPYLEGAPEWSAMIDRDGPPTRIRLLQLDIAVRDNRIDNLTGTGWAFGTFMYHKDEQHPIPWLRLRPVGILWETILPSRKVATKPASPRLKDG